MVDIQHKSSVYLLLFLRTHNADSQGQIMFLSKGLTVVHFQRGLGKTGVHLMDHMEQATDTGQAVCAEQSMWPAIARPWLILYPVDCERSLGLSCTTSRIHDCGVHRMANHTERPMIYALRPSLVFHIQVVPMRECSWLF